MHKLGKYVNIRTGKLDVNAADENGQFPFFTCAIEPLRINAAAFDCECALVAGNGDLNVKYYNGKFNAYQRTYIIESNDKEVLNPKYLYRFLDKSLRQLRSQTKGGVIQYLRLNDLTDLKINLPALRDQLHIANILSHAENLIAQRKESIRLLDEYLKSTFLEMFGDPIKNDNNWCLERLDKISKLQRGRFSPRPRNDPSYYVGKYPFIQTGDISKSENRLRTFNQTLNEKGIKVSKEFKKGTIVIAIVGATIGATAILEIDVYATDSIIGITAKSDLTNEYFLEFTLRFWKPVLLKNAPEAARANINLDILNKLKIAIPPIELQTHFSQIVEETEALKAQYQRSLRELGHLYGSLSQRAFKGELSAKDEEMLMAAEPQEDYITKQ